MRTENNIIALTDSYKISHHRQYPMDTTRVYSFLESRGGRYQEIVFFGLQYVIRKFLEGRVVTDEGIEEAKALFRAHFGQDLFNEAGWRHILEHHGGRLPLQIRAVPEGTRVPTGNVLLTVVNTDPRAAWLTNYVEGLLMHVWYPTTVATQSYFMKQDILRFLEQTGTPEDIDFKLHDFGFRGSTSVESAGIGGLAHLVNFKGSDTVPALLTARRYYAEMMAGFSIPAAEHSTITSWGRESEAEAYRNMLEQYPEGLVACVSDSYDIFRACDELWGQQLRNEVLNRQGTLVIRPDSGDPVEVIPRVLEILGSRFGSALNGKGYRVLNEKVRLIQGDGITYRTVAPILAAMEEAGWSADNIAFGSGGGLLQQLDRDTQKFALKCSAVQVDGEWRDVYKDPVTDHGKRSKAGRLALVQDDTGYRTVGYEEAGSRDMLVPVFEDGILLSNQSLADIRQRAMA